jgi:hypothetical protein
MVPAIMTARMTSICLSAGFFMGRDASPAGGGGKWPEAKDTSPYRNSVSE